MSMPKTKELGTSTVALHKDQSLDRLADVGNVAQFVSFAPDGLRQRYCRMAKRAPNSVFESPAEALTTLLETSADNSINLRTYSPESPRSRHFHYGLTSVEAALDAANSAAAEGLYVIANETVDVHDGGVSGVFQGDVVEFSPDDTPRCVEKPGVVAASREWGMKLLEIVYGFRPEALDTRSTRLEFSIHPKPRGWRGTHTLFWEYEEQVSPPETPSLRWPNRFSRVVGDKAFGLIVAHLAGLPVPRTTVVGRRIAPFTFGQSTGSHEVWTRTCPSEQEPGLFTTVKGWTDPFKLFALEDPAAERLSSVLCQAAVRSAYSGAAITAADGRLAIEGRAGRGDLLMLGKARPGPLPERVVRDVEDANEVLARRLGPVRFEWVHDGERTWIVQLHVGATRGSGPTLVPGHAEEWVDFDVALGLEALRDFLRELPAGAGANLVGHVGLTSHVADLVRKAGRPSRIAST